ncbi:SCARF2 [Branchiostoma lanceolatum]|uniref:SCARF2 protein n=1 Tax=Branchiostoma lanceolatum TaxID=7740 RepID=A0A8J9Z768_BRALA|nr:SCARF2 [Branchiostoma lanceolatum]
MWLDMDCWKRGTLFFIVLSLSFRRSTALSGVVCSRQISYGCTETYSQRYYTSCGFAGWDTCTRYRTASRQTTCYGAEYFCCDGHTNSGGVCVPVCWGIITCPNGGTCSSPNMCSSCNDGYYSPKCDQCTVIANCDDTRCTTNSDQRCHRCSGDYGSAKAYDNLGTSCREKCSWRQSSNNCYPGTCPTTPSTCSCSTGFGGAHCRTISAASSNMYCLAALSRGHDRVDANCLEDSVKYTNMNPTTLTVDWRGHFTPSVPNRPAYVQSHGLGLIAGGFNAVHVRGSSTIRNDRGTCSSAASRDNPIQMDCDENMHVTGPFNHGDKLRITADFTNGGYVTVYNRDSNNRHVKNYYSGVSTSTETAEFVFDYVAPTCTGTQLNIGDSVSKQNQITLQFSGWTDALSGVTKYEYEVYMLVATGNQLTEPHTTFAHGTISTSNIQHPTITLTTAGVYSVILTADDAAGNYRRTRRFVLYDNTNAVEIDSHHPLTIASSVAGNGDIWLHCTACAVTASWPNRFINRYHNHNKLLNTISEFSAGIDAAYDQTTGTRSKQAIPNALGVTQFQVAFGKDHAGGSTLTSASSWSAGDLNTQYSSSVSKVDGDTVKIWVKAKDIMNNEITDSVTVHIDSSAPVIENLWLASGDETNIVVHNAVELYEMEIQFDAFDQHSGLHDMTWTLADVKTSATITTGVVAVQTLTCGSTCTTNCVMAARGPCYKKDYTITFDRSEVADVGGHDHDFLLTLTVRNKATLSTTETLKITVDTSPPLPGNVHDGLKGQPEIDYQQTTTVNTWWDGFFDEESGVKFYQYGYSTSCLAAADFTLPEGASITRTTNTHAVYTAPSPGTYFCTVVAYNHALDPSPPVCSDGVTVDVTDPSLTAINIYNLSVRPGVVKDTDGDVWLINQRRHRVLVLDPPPQCRNVPQVSNIDDYAPRRDLVTNTTLSNQYCTSYSGAPTTSYLSADRNLFASWDGEDEGGIYDFSVGLSSTSSTSSPDIMAFTSTTAIPELRFSHPHISQNSLFHLVIKAEDRAGRTTTKAVGPIIVDVTPPQFTGRITLAKQGNFFVGRWTASDFFDDESQDPLQYEFAVGRHQSSTAMLRFHHVGANGPCVRARPPNCAAIGTGALNLPPSDSYYMFVKVTNPSSLSVIGISSAYSIKDKVPTDGIVFDIAPDMDDPGSHDYEDIDAQTDTGVLSARWFGFSDDPAAVTYEVAVGTSSGAQDVRPFTAASGTAVSITGLTLQYFQTYFITVRARNGAGSVTVSSDGVTVLEHDGWVGGMMVKDGPGCFENSSDTCQENAEFQRSTSTMWVRWNTPSNITDFLSEFYWTVEEELRDGSDSRAFNSLGCWKDKGNPAITALEGTDARLDGNFRFRENAIAKCYDVARSRGATVFALQSGGECFGSTDGHSTYNMYGPSTACEADGKGGPWANEVYQIKAWWRLSEPVSVKRGTAVQSKLNLRPGKRYRSVITPCYKTGCFGPVASSGVWITPNAPISGRLSVDVTGANGEGPSTIVFKWDAFRDGDAPTIVSNGYAPIYLSSLAIDRYEWALASGAERRELILPWTPINITSNDVERHEHTVSVARHILATGCPKLVVRGFSKVGLQSSVETDINDCSRNIIGRQHTVIDATGKIMLEKNALWTQVDADYTSSQSTLAAVWPSLRHGQYVFAVIEESTGISDYGSVSGRSQFPYPCSHPLAISCGNTTDEYVNVEGLALQHGRRYHICVHANRTTLVFETFSQELPAVSACSDGITVDHTPPSPGKVWIENSEGKNYQSSSSELVVKWESFVDLEEHGTSHHVSGIRTYLCAIGTSPGGIDVQDFTEVGNINSVIIHNLGLNSGIAYYATVKGIDFVGLSAMAVSDGVLVDTTPPVKNEKAIDIGGLFLQSLDSISVSWSDVFVDKDSGVTSFYWAVGSAPGVDDVVRLQPAENAMVEDSAIDPPLLEGHTYYVTTMAENGAGLVSTAISHGYVAETSPPEVGFVYDGPPTDPPNDLDYQTDKTTISAHWGGFHDPHTDIISYKWRVGTCPLCRDVLEEVDLGIKSDMSASNLPLVSGFTYYVTVTACNAAQLCTTASSDGVLIDDTPPIAGTVYDGAADMDLQYQPSVNLLRASWFGFHDAHSQLSHYEWRAGTSPGGSDILSPSQLHLAETALVTMTTPMPADTKIYVTVKAYNKAGLWAEKSSDGFVIDASAPTVTTPTGIDLSRGSLKADSQVVRTLLRATWKFDDPDTGIDYHLLSVSTSQETRHDLPTVKVGGNDQSYTFSNITLHDGNSYSLTVVACNRAQLCTESTSSQIKVDGSPPTVGTFAVGTDHVIDNQRPQSGWMTWQNNVNGNPTLLRLAWLGFTDVHSGIGNYLVFVGTNFEADNLIPSGPIEVAPSGPTLTTPEGTVHTAEIPVASVLSSSSTVYIKIIAVNEAGMRGPASHEAFSLVASAGDRGFLSLIRRCEAHSCLGDCICASQNKLCNPTQSCTVGTGVPSIDVYDTIDLTGFSSVSAADDIAHTPAGDFLAAKWTTNAQIIRYQWSAGIKDEAVGSGVFNLLTDKIWHDTDGANYAILNLPVTKDGAHTLRGADYVIYVRAWISPTTYKDFSSDGVEMDFSPPSVHRSTKVKDLMTTSATADIDYTTQTAKLVCGWDGVFYDTGSGIESFEVAYGLGPSDESISPYTDNKVSSATTTHQLDGLSLNEGIRYHCNVRAFNKVLLYSTASSDGVIVDTIAPTAGVVMDGVVLHDVEYTNVSASISASWHGFWDSESFLHHYMWCLGTTTAAAECSVLAPTDVGLRTAARTQLNTALDSGVEYYSKVYAVDAAGMQSDVATSDGVTIDTTPPVPLEKLEVGQNIVEDFSFEDSPSPIRVESRDGLSFSSLPSFTSSHWTIGGGSSAAVLNGSAGDHGSNVLYLAGSLSQQLTTTTGSKYRLTLSLLHNPFVQNKRSDEEVLIQAPGISKVVQLYRRPGRHDSKNANRWQKATIFFTATSASSSISVETPGRTRGILVDNVDVRLCNVMEAQEGMSSNNSVHVELQIIHGLSSVFASWGFVDMESPIVDYMWAIGTVQGGTQLQAFRSVGTSEQAINSNLTLTQGSNVYVTVVAVNAVGLRSVVHSQPSLVDKTPPVISFVRDGSSDKDVDFQSGNMISANWVATDPESGISRIEWAIGMEPGSSSISDYTMSEDPGSASKSVSGLSHGQTVYVTVRCHNNVGLYSTMSSDGVTIVKSPPSTAAAQLSVLTRSETHYPTRGNHQSQTDMLQLSWGGFTDTTGIAAYQYALEGPGVDVSIWSSLSPYGDTSTLLGLDLQPASYKVFLRAINNVQMESASLQAEVQITTTSPSLSGASNVTHSWEDGNVTAVIDWEGVFDAATDLVYEITIGTTLGGNDVQQWVETVQTNIKVGPVDPTKHHFGTITAINPVGMYENAVFDFYR